MDYRRSWRTVNRNKRWCNVRVWMVRCLFLVFLLLIAGCRYWGWRRVEQPTPEGYLDTVRIWTGGEVQLWYDVLISKDSVSGIPT